MGSGEVYPANALSFTIGLRMHSGGLVAESASGVTSYRWPSPTSKQRSKGE